MRRNDREIKSLDKLILIMKACDVCRVAFFDNEYPYIVPLNFGFNVHDEKVTLYFHGANEGKKMELMQKNPHVCFEMDTSHEFLYQEEACNSTMKYMSIIGNGILTNVIKEEKEVGLRAIMNQYVMEESYHFNEKMIQHTNVWKLEVTSITGKAR